MRISVRVLKWVHIYLPYFRSTISLIFVIDVALYELPFVGSVVISMISEQSFLEGREFDLAGGN